MHEIKYGNFLLETDLPVITVHEARIEERINQHGRLWVKAAFDSSSFHSMEPEAEGRSVLRIYECGAERNLIFHGRIQGIHYQCGGRYVSGEIWGAGSTVLLDRKKNSRSFQDISLAYEDVAERILDGQGDYAWAAPEGRSIQSPIIQYEETDWEFLLRTASRLHVPVIPSVTTARPVACFGMKERAERSLREEDIIERHMQQTPFHPSKKYAMLIKAQSREPWDIGDFCHYEHIKYTVYEREVSFSRGELTSTATLGTDGKFYEEKKPHPMLKGAGLEGTVKGTEKESIRLQLDIDADENADYLWPWVPETGNAFYCMPETGTRASLYFPTDDEKDGAGLFSFRQPSAGSGQEYRNLYHREMATPQGKKIGLYPSELVLEGMDGRVRISMLDTKGIDISSFSNINLSASADITLAGNKISVLAPTQVACRTRDSNIDICKDFNIYAPEGVKAEGTNKTEIPRIDPEEEEDREEEGYWQMSYSAMAAIPALDLNGGNNEEINDINIIDMHTCGMAAKTGKGTATIAMNEVMGGRKEKDTSFPQVFRAMDIYTVKGGYRIPEE